MILVTLFDIFWLIIVWKSWTADNSASPIWNRLRFWHIFIITTTIVNMVLKVVSCVLVFLESKNKNPYQSLEDDRKTYSNY